MIELLEDRIKNTEAEMTRMLSTMLYGDDEESPPPTRWDRLKQYISVRRDRVHDAWLVLTGQADIGY